MSVNIYKDIAQTYAAAAEKAPGLKTRFAAAGFDPAAVETLADLSSLPVMKKEELLKIQREKPPFGGFLGADLKDIGRIYVSPGPIFEPSLSGIGGHGLDLLFKAAGVGAGDVILNTWMYHLVPAGLLFDEAAQAAGATVIPGGVGNTELQAQIIVETGVTAICASTAFFLTLADKVIETYGRDAWKVKTAFLGGEMGDWMAKRRRIEADYGVSTWAAYATADLGNIAYESPAMEGLIVDEQVIVEIVTPGTGIPVAPGEVGEVVVTTLNPDYPLIRFATGDLSAVLEGESPCGRTNMRIKGWMGRADQTTKIKGMFVRPEQVAALVAQHEEIEKARVIASREGEADVMTVQIETVGVDKDAYARSVADLLKLKGRVELVAPGSLPRDGLVIEDTRSYD